MNGIQRLFFPYLKASDGAVVTLEAVNLLWIGEIPAEERAGHKPTIQNQLETGIDGAVTSRPMRKVFKNIYVSEAYSRYVPVLYMALLISKLFSRKGSMDGGLGEYVL